MTARPPTSTSAPASAPASSPISSPASSPASLVDLALGPYRTVARFLERRTLVRVARALPRALAYLTTPAVDGTVAEAVTSPRIAPLLAAGVAADEAFLAVALAPSRFPRRADYARVSAELATARELFAERGWLDRPRTYHRDPPALTARDLTSTSGWAMGLGYERISFDSGFAPRADEPGRDRWNRFGPNRTASAAVVRHGGPEGAARPWIICVHGFGMGYASADFAGLRAAQLHHGLGANLVLPVLPLHGPRKVTRLSGEPFLSFDLMNTVHGFAQAVWDIRRLLAWVRAQGATSIGLYGVSLGAYVVSLLAGIEDGLDAVVAGIPMVDLPALFHELSPLHVRARSIEHHIIGGNAEAVFDAVSPCS